jgi:hypothetical protein
MACVYNSSHAKNNFVRSCPRFRRYKAGGTLQSTTPDGKSITVKLKAGDIRFNRRERAHSELQVSGKPHAIIVELK